jgi:hypothetical protein
MSTELAIVDEKGLTFVAKAFVDSRMFGFKSMPEALSVLLLAQAEGLHPAAAAMEYGVIHGRPTRKADAILARFQKSGGSIKWIKYSDEVCSATFSHPQGSLPEPVTWTMEMAKAKGLTGKNENYAKYPRQMLSARVISEGVRKCFPGATGGMYTPEEAEDMPREVTPPIEREVVGERIDKPAVGRVQLEGEIDRATTLQQLEDLVPLIQALPSEDRNALRARYAAQKHRLNARPVTEDDAKAVEDFWQDEAAA